MQHTLAVVLSVAALTIACSGGKSDKKVPEHLDEHPPTAVPEGGTDAGGGHDVAIEMTEFSVEPGGEAYRCQNFANPFGGPVDVDRFEAHMPEGSHHMIVFFVDDITDGPLEECSGSEFHPNVFGAQTPDGVIDLPRGVGVAMPPRSGLRFQLHYVNETEHPVTAGVKTLFHVADPGSIVDHAGQLLFSNEDIDVPPSQRVDVTKTCNLTKGISLLGASAHVHRHAVDFVATAGDTLIYRTTGWSDLTPARFTPPLELPEGQPVTFTCTYKNDTGATLKFGESALTDEMCILGAIYYPVDDVTLPNLLCF